MNKLTIILILLVAVKINAGIEIIDAVKKHSTAFVIVTDKTTFENCNPEILSYRDAIESENISCFILTVEKENPTEIRNRLEKLYKAAPSIEGAVFVGDIPIPMIRDAQHLTSAYKKDQSRGNFHHSSVPSDRFYEDFDLQFEFLERNTTHTNCYYYSLLPQSPQKIKKEIYSGRIKAPVNSNEKYSLIKKYLKKVVAYKKVKSTLKNMLMFTGHGYISESLTAWSDDYLYSKEQYPNLFKNKGKFKNLFASMSTKMKTIIMRELENPELDIALFNAHGAPDTQYLIEYPTPMSAKAEVEDIKLFLRHKLRSAKRRKKDLEKTKNYYIKNYGVPENWFDGTFSDSVKTADSLLAYSLDLYSEDLKTFDPKVKFIMFNQCFNGSFQNENYISGRYIFDNGNVISSTANSVNVLQDVWANKFLGLLDLGVSVGRRHLFVNYLENHIIGDPTFAFESAGNKEIADAIVSKRNDNEFWEKLISHNDLRIKALSIEMYFQTGNKSFTTLKNIYKNESSVLVRRHCFYIIAKHFQNELRNFLPLAIADNDSYIRRVASKIMGKMGGEEFIPALVKNLFTEECKRVSFNSKSALTLSDSVKAKKIFFDYYNNLPEYSKDEKVEKYYSYIFKKNTKWLREDIIEKVTNKDIKLRKRLFACRTLRNYNFVNSYPAVNDIIDNKDVEEKIKVYLVEALGWFYYSEKKDLILERLKQTLITENSELVKKELLKSINRLTEGPNEPFTP
ncbi:MAG: hypothetical protein ACEPO8_15930 [Rhodothermaceae bacterium]